MGVLTSPPDWIGLYRSGITGAGVAAACKVDDILEVLNVLADAKRRDPSLEDEHAANRGQAIEARENTARQRTLSPTWRRRIDELTAYVEDYGRMPRQTGGDEAETSLGRWLHAQRAKVAKGLLEPRQRAALDAVGVWDSGTRAQREEARFPGRLRAVIDFRTRHRRLPSYRNRASELESSLGTWLHTLRQAESGGRLPAPSAHEAGPRPVRPGLEPLIGRVRVPAPVRDTLRLSF